MAEGPLGVVGLGNWGTALSHHLASLGHEVVGWCREGEIAESITRKQRNPTYLKDVSLHPRLRATTDIREIEGCEVVVIVVPSRVLGVVLSSFRPRAEAFVVSATKGIEPQHCLTPLQSMRRVWGETTYRYSVLSGPSFAHDVAAGRPCGVVAAGSGEDIARRIAATFRGTSMRVFTSTDMIGVELGGIVKNVIALAAGVSDGLGYGDSARAGLITRGLAEMVRLGLALGADMRTFMGLSGLGDLVMTASCDQSRNRTVGMRLGRGDTLDEIVKTLGSEAEAVTAAPLVLRLAEERGVELPIVSEMVRVVTGQATAREAAEALLSRPVGREFP